MYAKNFATIVILTLMMVPLCALGQTGAYVGPHIGFQKSQDADEANVFFGGTLRLNLIPGLGAEADIGYRQEKFGGGAVTVKEWPVTVTGLLYVLPIVYGGIGAGWYNTTYDYSAANNQLGFSDNTDQKFGWHLAAGVELPTSTGLKLFGDIRYVFLDREFKDLPNAVLDGEESDFYSINAGLLFSL